MATELSQYVGMVLCLLHYNNLTDKTGRLYSMSMKWAQISKSIHKVLSVFYIRLPEASFIFSEWHFNKYLKENQKKAKTSS